jgi:branched-subunit amino acid ABC-type transport system permease component
MLPQLLITGLAIGSIYALIGLSLVLINKATDVVNFAQGELAMFSTFLSFTADEARRAPAFRIRSQLSDWGDTWRAGGAYFHPAYRQ